MRMDEFRGTPDVTVNQGSTPSVGSTVKRELRMTSMRRLERLPETLAVATGVCAYAISLRLQAAGARRLVGALTAALAASHVIDVSGRLRLALTRFLFELRARRAWLVGIPRTVVRADTCSMVVGPESIDRNHHFNNGRYFLAANIARRKLLLESGISGWLAADAKRARAEDRTPLNLIIASQCIRYRRELVLFQRYVVRSTLKWWMDPSTLMVESRFVTHAGTEREFVNAVQLVKYRLVGRGSSAVAAGADATCTISSLLAQLAPEGVESELRSLELTSEVALFEQFDRVSSDLLRVELGRPMRDSAAPLSP